MPDSSWPLIHRERDALAADLASISPEQWDLPSLCAGWSVRDVVAHLTATALMTPPRFFVRLAAARFSFRELSEQQIRRHRGSSGAEALAQFRSAAHRTSSPPGPGPSWIGEVVVHAEDIRRPLGIAHSYDPEALRRAANFYPRSNAIIGAKRRVAGVRLEASDTDWASGTGPVARGPLLALLMVTTGRSSFLDDLSGDGVAVLRGRG